jgi:hypothetical protein
LIEKVTAPVYKADIATVGIPHPDYAIHFYPQNSAITSPTSGGCSVVIVCSRFKATELLVILLLLLVVIVEAAAVVVVVVVIVVDYGSRALSWA